jgi:hypothetical protein
MPLLFRAVTIVFFLRRMWRMLPASQKRKVLSLVGRHGPPMAGKLYRRTRGRLPGNV